MCPCCFGYGGGHHEPTISRGVAILVPVVAAQCLPSPMLLVSDPLEITAIILSIGVVTLVPRGGETKWFEGLQLLGVYIILCVFFYFLPASRG